MKISFQTLLLLYLQVVLLMGSSSVIAGHSFGGMDLCALYPEVMPPGLMPNQLPDAGGQGAVLMQGYCTQCHALPGPGRHSVEEWTQVLDRMLVLMDVADRFGSLLGNVGASAFESHCSGCHVLPDPARYNHVDWSSLIKRMQHNMEVMKYPPPSADIMMQIQLYLQKNAKSVATSQVPVGEYLTLDVDGDSIRVYDRSFNPGSWLALGPFFMLIVIGLVRWWNNHQHVNRQAGTKQIKA
jgi:cytochrome c5